ncbi:MAG TPA: ZIP family metal transporter [Actinomycetota bacterium]
MSTGQTILLGAIAGFTIFLGLPMGRIRSQNVSLKTFLNGVSAGILVFLLFDILENATEPLENAVSDRHFGTLAGIGTVYAVGLGVGLLGLLYVSRLWRRRSPRASLGPGAMAVTEIPADRTREALRVGMSIATGIGLHNFSEGLAIGQAAHAGQVSLALLLVVGFGLHNATEGFGIIGPLAATDTRPSWGWLALAGLVGGGPTFLGTVVGTSFTSQYVNVAFLTLAAGAILYVVGELFNAGRRLSWETTLWGVLAGFLAGLATEMVVVAAGV